MGSTLGTYQINIAQMSVGRPIDAQPGGEAIGVLNLDSIPTKEVTSALASQNGITSVKSIELPNAGEKPPWI